MIQVNEIYKTPIDLSHKYTNVFSDGFRGPGEAYHNYDIVQKDDKGNTVKHLAEIRFQNGPIKEVGINGVMDENLITIVIDRLKGFQSGKFACEHNAAALENLERALMFLKDRTKGRELRGVEGTHQV